MLSLIKQIKQAHFGIFPEAYIRQKISINLLKTPIARASIASELVLPVKQHIGKPGNLNCRG